MSLKCKGLFKFFVGVLTTCHLVLQMHRNVISFYGVALKYQVYVPPLPASIPELKVRIRTAIETITADMIQFGTNSIIVLMFVESQRMHI